jgi:DNA-binding transcriptional LysR family regulator
MGMDRLRRVADLWNWLPAFRVVAEYESIQKAAVVLNVSPSALSRTVRLLEEGTGHTLFVRGATGLSLTAFGAELLKGTRDAMRRVDDVLDADAVSAGEDRSFVAGAQGPVLARLLDLGLAGIVRRFDDVRFKSHTLDDEGAVPELLRGNLDLALLEGAPEADLPPDLATQWIGDLPFAVFAPSSHPLYARSGAATATEIAAAKVVQITGVSSQDRTTRPFATVASPEAAERLADLGPFLALLPLALASGSFHVVAPSKIQISATAVFRRRLDGEAPAIVVALVEAMQAIRSVRA